MILDQSFDTIFDDMFLMSADYSTDSGGYDADGIWQDTMNTITIPCHIQPLSNKDIQNLPDGYNPAECKTIWTTAVIDDAKTSIISYGGRNYTVYNLENRSEYNFYRALLIYKG